MKWFFIGAIAALWANWFCVGLWFHFSSPSYVLLLPTFFFMLGLWLSVTEGNS